MYIIFYITNNVYISVNFVTLVVPEEPGDVTLSSSMNCIIKGCHRGSHPNDSCLKLGVVDP